VTSDLDALRSALSAENLPACAALTPFEVVTADFTEGIIRLTFAPQPAFGNHFGDIQGGFVVAMLDTPLPPRPAPVDLGFSALHQDRFKPSWHRPESWIDENSFWAAAPPLLPPLSPP
jgi:hypothetical protein